MKLQDISPDQVVYWQWGPFSLNATIVFTWGIMAFLVIGSWLVTRRLSTDENISRWQNMLEIIVKAIRDEIRQVTHQGPEMYMPLIGTLFLFIGVSNVLSVIPWFSAPTASLSTTTALALCVFVAVPLYGVSRQGLLKYLKQYVEPTIFMLPFNIMGELSRTLALAVRLYGNIMSSAKIVAILLTLVPLFVPIVMDALGLLTGLIQAYIFGVLAMVYISSATRAHQQEQQQEIEENEGES